MFCHNCGNQLTEGDLFCSSCGTPSKQNTTSNHNSPVKSEVSGKTVVVTCIAVILSILLVCGLVNFFDNKNNIVGEWEAVASIKGYPDHAIFIDNGNGIVDSFPCTWSLKNHTLEINITHVGEETYKCKVDGDKMYLDGYEYNRVK